MEENNRIQKKVIVIIGATGMVGGLIARCLKDKDVELRFLVRPESRGKIPADLANINLFDSAAEAFNGAYAVVSAVQGSYETIVEAQLDWLEIAENAGVKRFIASDYTYNYFGTPKGDSDYADVRNEFAEQAKGKKGDAEVVHILVGPFMPQAWFEFFPLFDFKKDEVYQWGNGNQNLQFTTSADAAAFAAEVAVDDRPVPEKLFFAGDSLTFQQMVAEVSAGLERSFTIVKHGTIEDLEQAWKEAKSKADGTDFTWQALEFLYANLNNPIEFGILMNDRYPAVQPIGVRDFAKSYLR